MQDYETKYMSQIHSDMIPEKYTAGRTFLVNIETTGLSARKSFVYMIGTASPDEQVHGQWNIRCMLAENRMDEHNLLAEFSDCIRGAGHIITFGGRSFSYRFLSERWFNYSDTDLFSGIGLTDIQQSASPYRTRLGLEDTKKKSFEKMMGISRDCDIAGKDLMDVYSGWETGHDDKNLSVILSHHSDDIRSLIVLASILSYTDLWSGNFSRIISYEQEGGRFIFTIKLCTPVPKKLCYTAHYVSVCAEKDTAVISVPVYTGQLKYFLPGPVSDYYYLPAEDVAIHKSVAVYADRSHRVKATPQTCYTKKEGTFIPTDDSSLTPNFSTDYRTYPLYISCDPQKWEQDNGFLSKYIQGLLRKS